MITANAETSGLALLRAELKQRGWNRKATWRVLAELGLHLTFALGGIVVVVLTDSMLLAACGMLVSTAGSMGVGTNTHTSSHYGTSDKRWVNELLTTLGYPLFLGLSATYWHYMHVIRHHPAPNVLGRDMDHDLMPWFSIVRQQVAATSGLRRFYYERLQWLVIPLALAFNAFNFEIAGWRYVIAAVRDPERRRKGHWIDMGALSAHLLLWLAAPMLFFPVSHVLAFYLVRMVLLGYAMFAVLAPGHYPAEAILLEDVRREEGFKLRQAATSLNFRTGFVGRFLCSGLEYQIEHHLCPDLSHVHYPELSRLVKEYCRDKGYPHRTLGWGEAIWKSLEVFRRPKAVHSSVAESGLAGSGR